MDVILYFNYDIVVHNAKKEEKKKNKCIYNKVE